jgi:spermidine/putrescine transport system substrate-binding protein
MKRNTIFFAVPAALLLFAITSCTPRLRIYNWTAYTPDSIIEKFEKEFNVRVVYDMYASNEEMLAKLQTGGARYDIVFPSGDFVPILMEEGMLEKIDKSKMENLGNIDPDVLQKITFDPDMEYAVPYFYGAAGIIVNTARIPESSIERSWSIFGRADLQDRMTMLDDMREVMGGALMHLGYSVNTRNPDQIIAARDLIINEWKPNLVKFDSETFGQGYANGDFWLVHGFPEIIFEDVPSDSPLWENTFFFIPDEGGPSYIDSMVILKGSKNVDLAHKFIDFIHRPAIYAEFVNARQFPSTVNVPARQLETGYKLFTTEDLANTELVTDLGLAFDLYTDAWDSIIIGIPENH